MVSMEWDLSVLVNGFDDPKIQDSIDFSQNRAEELIQKYKGKIIGLSAESIAEMIILYEEIFLRNSEVNQFARLSVSADSTNVDALKLLNLLQKIDTDINKKLTFITLELGEYITKKPGLIDEKDVIDIKYFLTKIGERQKYRLSEIEEGLIMEKNLFGRNEWSKLQGEWLSKKKFPIMIDGELKEFSWSQGASLISHPQREVREEAVEKLFQGLKEDRDLYAFALRNICADTITEYNRRGYPNYMEASFSFSNIEKEMFDAMIEVVEENVGLFQEYLGIKAKILGTEKLLGEDLYAPPPFKDNREISWEEATQMIKDGYNDFDQEFGDIASDMIDNKRIDSIPRPGKRGGAFCSPWYNKKTAFIMQSFTGTMSNVKTLAHEMGHAVHAYLASRSNRLLTTSAGMSLAESASEFGNMLFTDKFLKEAENDEIKKAVLYDALSGLMISIFEVSSRTRIEQKLYDALDKGEFLSADKINEIFWEGRNIYFGDAIQWRENQVYEWCFKGHYYISGLRFYNYPYVFGELLVLSLYNAYKKEGKDFVPKYKEYLSSGGSKSAGDLVKIFGFDLSTKEFWNAGIEELRRMFELFKSVL